jgi:DNA-binding transcriptional LysR family regulator
VNTGTASELEFFILLARHGSLSAAARALDITPPAASKRLAQMEQRLGLQLVYYAGRANQPVRTRAFIDFLVEHFRKPVK